jgi:Flp pilus assembly protein TadG
MRYLRKASLRASTLRALARDKRGASAVEFAAIATPFVFLIFAVCELALVSMTQASLDFALSNTQRLVRVGQAQNASMDASALKTQLCTQMQRFMPVSCSNLYLDVRTFASFSSASQINPLNNGNLNNAAFTFNMGGADEVVLVRGFYEFPLLTPGLNLALSNMSGNKRLLGASALIRTEPFLTTPP